MRAAAERAIALGSYDQALAFLEQVLGITSDPGDTAELLERAGEAAAAGGRNETAEAHLRQAISARRELGDRAAVARASAALGRTFIDANQISEALALLERAATEFADLAADPTGIALGGQLARAYFLTSDQRRAVEVADRVLEAAEHAELAAVLADTLVTRGSALEELGRPIEGLALLTAGQELAEEHGLGPTVVRALTNRSAFGGARDPRAALELVRAGLTRARRLGLRSYDDVLLGNAANNALRTGDWSWAIVELEAALAEESEALDRPRLLWGEARLRAVRGEPIEDQVAELRRLVADISDPQQLSLAPDVAAFAAFAAGRLDDARTAWLRAADLWANSWPGGLATSLPRAARAALWAGDAAAASDDLAVLDAGGVHGPAIVADRRTIQAGITALEGRPADALTLYREALRAWRDLGLAWDEALCGLDMATLLNPTEPEVRAAAQAAREILVRLEAAPFLARLDAAMERRRVSTPAAVQAARLSEPGQRPS